MALGKLIENLLTQSMHEVIEPETIRNLMPSAAEEDFNMMEAILTVKSSNYPFENFYAFENVVRALNNVVPRVDMLEGANPEWIWYACDIIAKLRPSMEISHEVVEYIKKIYVDEGIYFLHPHIIQNAEDTDLSAWAQIYKAAKHKTANGPFPVEADSFINRQAIELMKIELYCENMENN